MTDFNDELGAILAGESPKEAMARETGLETEAQAEGMVEYYNHLMKHLEEADKKRQEYIARINDRFHRETQEAREEVEKAKAQLEQYAKTALADGSSKKKSIKLVCGTIGFRAGSKSLKVDDSAAAIAWLEKHGHADVMVRVKKEIDKTMVKKLIENKGELPDGVELVIGPDSFYVK
jgi:phage host-nuclease inhibitor protein Gam